MYDAKDWTDTIKRMWLKALRKKDNYGKKERKMKRVNRKLRKFSHGKLYRFKEDYYYEQPYPLKSGLIPKGTVVRFDCPNLGFARFIFTDIKLTEKFNDYSISLKPKDAFRVLEEVGEVERNEV